MRNLEREIADVCRAVAADVAKGEQRQARHHGRGPRRASSGREKFYTEIAERTERAGVATGLAWTPAGGDILFIEATKMPGKGSITLTGQLGDVMKESAQAALSYARNKAREARHRPDDFFEKQDIHIHVPAGAIPKDGPSAGVTMVTALTSLLTGSRVRDDVAMTGEITLRGQVLPVGGIKEKVLAAHRAGIKRIILPKRNEKDLDDVPEQAKKEMEFIFAHSMDDVLRSALEEDPFAKAEKNPPPAEQPAAAGEQKPPEPQAHA